MAFVSLPSKTEKKVPVYYLTLQVRSERLHFHYFRVVDPEFSIPEPQTKRRVVIIRAKLFPRTCLPTKVKKSDSGSFAWRRKNHSKGKYPRVPQGRPTLLLPPMGGSEPAAPVLTTRVQDRIEPNRDFLSLETEHPLPEPSAPSPGHLFYNSEDHSDITFIVGPEEWRFPAHSFVLSKTQGTLSALLRTATRPTDLAPPTVENQGLNPASVQPPLILKLPEMQPDLFEQILRYVYTGQTNLSSVDTTLRLLSASQMYNLPQLTSLCLNHLSHCLTPGNALSVLSRLRIPPPLPHQHREHNDNERNELVLQCLLLVDRHAEEVLQGEPIETLDHELLMEIVQRDTLLVSCESLVFDAVMRWACRACKRQRKALTPENKCTVLGKVLYLVRYLTMTLDEFVRGPVSQGVLSKEDKDMLLSRLTTNSNSLPLPDKWREGKIHVKRHAPEPPTSSPEGIVSPTNSLQPVKRDDRKKKSMSKKLLNGVGDLVICVIQLLD